METKRIKCPSCGAILDVRNTKNESVKLIKCPKCKATLSVKFKKQEPLEAHTYLAPGKANNGETQYAGFKNDGETQLGKPINDGETQLGGYSNSGETQIMSKVTPSKSAYLKVNGKSYPLRLGTNIIGRKATTSQATVQIDTPDRYMSRQHSKIVVSKLPNGRLKSVLSNDHNKNISTIDGQDLLQGEQIVLEDGDQIVMGKTTVIYKEQ